MKTLFLAMLFPITTHAVILNDCGRYRLVGIIVKNKAETGYSFVLNKTSKSEYNFKIEMEDELKIAPYVNKEIAIEGFVDQISNQRGHLQVIYKSELAAIDRLNGNSNYLLIKKSDCSK